MIREHRSREKLATYYRKFVEEGIMDPNVHPWVAESWRRSRQLGVSSETMDLSSRIPEEELRQRQERHGEAMIYLERMSEGLQGFFQKYGLCLFLVDTDCVILRSFSFPFCQKPSGELEGVRVGVEEVGTSSISLALEHRASFWLYGPEMWVKECHTGDACSAPVEAGGELCCILTMASMTTTELPRDAAIALLWTMKHALEQQLTGALRRRAEEAILNAAPLAVYHILPGGEVAYANCLGKKRLEDIGVEKGKMPNLREVILNFSHTPLEKGLEGATSHNEEVTWITREKTYEDITTVVPLAEGAPGSIVVVSMPIEDLRTLVAHAAGYTAKYSLSSMVGKGSIFSSVKDKAARVARNGNHVLLQGESGTGKQRMAHGIHQASTRAGGPLITLRCGDGSPELLEQEIFGMALCRESSHPGRLELASGGTLFLDEIEKMPGTIADELAEVLLAKRTRRLGEEMERPIDVRIIAACDGDLKRLVERGLFSRKLYGIISRSVIRMPTLRSRREDIPGLAMHIIMELAQQHQMEPKSLLPEAEEKLRNYDWPGNIKQLQAVLEQAFFHTWGKKIGPGDINIVGIVSTDDRWKQDREVFLCAWQAAGGNVSRLANLLGVSRVTLYRYLKKYGLERK